MQQIRGYANRSSNLLCLSTRHLGCRQVFPESWVLCRLVQYVNRAIGLSIALSLWAISKLNSEFVSDLNLECLCSLEN